MSVSGLALSALASLSVRTTAPELAIRLNPLDPQARINLASEQLLGSDELNQDAFESVLQAIAFNRSDARLRSVLGLLELRVGQVDSAYNHFETARRMLPTEIQALTQLIRRDFELRDYDSVAEQLDMYARRWRAQWPAVEPYAKELARSEPGLLSLSEQFRVPRAQRDIILMALLSPPSQLNEAQSLVEDWVSAGLDPTERLGRSLIVAKFRERQFASAYDFYRRFLSRSSLEDNDKDNLVQNNAFQFSSDGTPFDWRILSTKGAYQDTDIQTGLITQFLDSPVRLNSPRQSIPLQSGKYELSVNYSTESLGAPGAIELLVTCGNELVSALPFKPGSQENETGSVTFEVSDSSCDIHDIVLTTEKLPESRQFRFSGKIIIHNVELRKL